MIRARIGLDVAPVAPGAVWIHAASVGEVGAAEVLVRSLGEPVLLTTDTPGGQARAASFTTSQLLPFDVGPALAPLWAQARPRVLVFVEGTFWPGLAALAAREGVPVLRVSAKAGAGTRRVPGPLLGALWRHTTAVAARDVEEARFFRRVQRAPVTTLGDLKDGVRPSPSPLSWSRRPIVGASLRGDDARILLAAWSAMGAGRPLLLAPRHPHDLNEAWLAGMRWIRRSRIAGRVPDDIDVVVLDTLGELGRILEHGEVAFIGGTFDPAIGGHSPREAQAWGVPVVCGPHTASSPGAFVGAVRVGSPDALADGLRRAAAMAKTPRVDEEVGLRIAAFVRDFTGAPAPERAPRPWARPLTVPYGVGRWAHGALTSFNARSVGIPVVSVGSSNARSPGRTSTVIWLAQALRARGHRVGVASRGYGRQTTGLAVSWVGATAAELGDEGALHAWHGSLVACCADRWVAAQALQERGATIVVLDDGLQSVELRRDLDVVVGDARFPRARGLFPAGERRDLRPAVGDVRLAHHGALPGAIAVRRRPGPWFRGDAPAAAPDQPVTVWVGVGHPEGFLATLDVAVQRTVVSPDHGRPDLDALGAGPLVCTDKDWVRLPEAVRATTWHRGVVLDVADVAWLPGPP